VLLTDEEEIMNHEAPTLKQSSTSREVHEGVRNPPLRRCACRVWTVMLIAKLNYFHLAETLILEDDSSSLDNNCSHSSLSGTDNSSEYGPHEDEEHDWDIEPAALPPQTARSSQKMAFEVRISHP
jgi:hypothetical protein